MLICSVSFCDDCCICIACVLYLFSRAKSAVVCGPGEYQVVKCGASGHNVRSRPSLKAPPVGMLVLGNHVTVVDHVSYQCIFSKFCVYYFKPDLFEQLMGIRDIESALYV